MNVALEMNSAVLTLEPGETFYLKNTVLRGVKDFNWCVIPPYFLGSPIVRILYGSYFKMRCVKAPQDQPRQVSLRGVHARGNFHAIKIAPKEKYYVNGHYLAGFSDGLGGLCTHIKFRLGFWMLRRHFFPVFTGPGTVLIYSESPIEEAQDKEFQPDRLMAFNIDREFFPLAPQPTALWSKLANLFSTEVIWVFKDDGISIATRHTVDKEEDENKTFFRRLFEHGLGLLKF